MKDIIGLITRDSSDMEHRFCVEVLKLNSLHFGYWQDCETLTMGALRTAQTKYTDELLSHVPEKVRTVLDVGCGIGDNAIALAKRGFQVTAISPDRNHKKFFVERPDVVYHNVKFESLDLSEKFDLILMSESQNYFDAGAGFRQCQRYLSLGGYLLICGLFKKSDNGQFTYIRNVEEHYIDQARCHCLVLRKSIDITENILPTLEYANRLYGQYVLPALDILKQYAEASSPIKRALFKLFCRREIEAVKILHDYYVEFFDTQLFKANVKYMTQLYQYDIDSCARSPRTTLKASNPR